MTTMTSEELENGIRQDLVDCAREWASAKRDGARDVLLVSWLDKISEAADRLNAIEHLRYCVREARDAVEDAVKS